MADDRRISLRPLLDGRARAGFQLGWKGPILEIALDDDSGMPALEHGALVEAQTQTWLYLGAVQESGPSRVSILVEHALERRNIESIRDLWG